MSEVFEVTSELVGKIEEVLGRGLCTGKGDPQGRMCVEAAVCFAMGLPHGDDPPCVGLSVRNFKITLNDSKWSSDLARAKGMRKIAIAQLGSNTLDQLEFARRMVDKTIRILTPTLFREVFKDDEGCLKAADGCETGNNYIEVTNAATATAQRRAESAEFTHAACAAAHAASRAAAACSAAHGASAADAAYIAATYAAVAARAATHTAHAAARAATHTTHAARAASDVASDAASRAATHTAEAARAAADATYSAATHAAGDKYLILSADLCFQALQEMDSPGAVWMSENNWE